ncbi:MAG: urea ABC transporter ATP-binding protein UrtD [Chloroflexi bacterium]|nr:urea ABC transporter ATP-binding protein UrtD [Chloroflexota bacterium]MDA1269966.1 urea ABC transporter ATP-binding protein UrtD [Chloroflexota bacterium]
MEQNGHIGGADISNGHQDDGTQNILSVSDVTISFDGFTVLDNLGFFINRGEMRFLIGPNGAGKTTLLDVITGKSKPDRGIVTFDGEVNLSRRSEHAVVKLGISRKFQAPTVFNSLSILQNLETSVRFRNRVIGMFRSLSATQSQIVQQTLELIGFEGRAHRNAGVLSHGERQWLEIGMLLVQEPKLLLLDEPVAGMTRRERDRTGELLQEIARERSVLVVEHDMEFVRRFAKTVTVLHQGKVLSEGTMDMVQQDPKVVHAYLGRSREASRHAVPAGHKLSANGSGALEPEGSPVWGNQQNLVKDERNAVN